MTEPVVWALAVFPLFIMAVVLHEVSHGWVALRFGDTTALTAGRLTLNPLKHVDLFGTVILPILLVAFKAPFVFGWAKPVPIDMRNFRRPRRDMLWVGAAGPATNFLLAVGAAFFLRLSAGFVHPVAVYLLKYFVVMNLVLGTFNLIPIPPLDGSRILTGLVPLKLAVVMLAFERWGVLVVLALLYLGVLDRILWPVVSMLAKLLGV